jgi:ABC-type uncharacterized transport system YnjBCD ATPase subunit
MKTQMKATKSPKLIESITLEKRAEKAVFTLQKTVLIGMRQECISRDRSLILNEQICALDVAFRNAFIHPVKEETSKAELPF